jgi:hypothetical protein
MGWLNVFIGAALLLFGRRLFWLFVGCVGFIAGFEIAGEALQGQPEWMILLIALGVGLLGAIASIFLQRIFIIVAGFFAGGYCLSTLAPAAFHSKAGIVVWLAFAVGGLLGAILTAALLDPALILLSSLAGATAVSQNVPLNAQARALIFVVLAVFGIIVQAGQYAGGKKSRPPQRTE